MKPSGSRPAVRGVLVAMICLSVTGLAAGWSPADWIADTPLVRALARPASWYGAGGSPSPQTPTVTAAMTGAIATDVDADGKADPGDTIRYTAVISAAGADAAGVHFADTPDANTTLVGGSIVISPLAAGETYNSVGNMTLTSSAIAASCGVNPLRSVTCNDTLNGGTLTAFGATEGTAAAVAVNGSNTVTTGNSGTVTLNTDGTFVYNPAAGFEGIDTFWYTLSNGAGTDHASVTINVGNGNGMVWFVSSGGGGTGRQANPISLQGFRLVNNGTSNNPASGDTIFLFEGSHALTATLALLSAQKFIGQDTTAALADLGAPTPMPGNVYPAVSNPTGMAVSVTSTVAAVTLGSDNTLAGFTDRQLHHGRSCEQFRGLAEGTRGHRQYQRFGHRHDRRRRGRQRSDLHRLHVGHDDGRSFWSQPVGHRWRARARHGRTLRRDWPNHLDWRQHRERHVRRHGHRFKRSRSWSSTMPMARIASTVTSPSAGAPGSASRAVPAARSTSPQAVPSPVLRTQRSTSARVRQRLPTTARSTRTADSVPSASPARPAPPSRSRAR